MGEGCHRRDPAGSRTDTPKLPVNVFVVNDSVDDFRPALHDHRRSAADAAKLLVLGDETLREIARELVETVRNNVRIDWTLRENVRANLRRLVKRILRKHGYPPDKQEKATRTVLEQAEVLSEEWAV